MPGIHDNLSALWKGKQFMDQFRLARLELACIYAKRNDVYSL
jgi:hypothetical protein